MNRRHRLHHILVVGVLRRSFRAQGFDHREGIGVARGHREFLLDLAEPALDVDPATVGVGIGVVVEDLACEGPPLGEDPVQGRHVVLCVAVGGGGRERHSDRWLRIPIRFRVLRRERGRGRDGDSRGT